MTHEEAATLKRGDKVFRLADNPFEIVEVTFVAYQLADPSCSEKTLRCKRPRVPTGNDLGKDWLTSSEGFRCSVDMYEVTPEAALRKALPGVLEWQQHSSEALDRAMEDYKESFKMEARIRTKLKELEDERR